MRVTAGSIVRAGRSRLVRGLRTKFRASIRPSDTFLVTYPRSGTTWATFFLANVLRSRLSDQVNLKTIVESVPDVNEEYFGRGSLATYETLRDPRIFSVHAQCDPAFRKVVYLLRDPRDVMVSYWHFRRLTDPKFGLTLAQFVYTDNHWPCPWDEHVAGWLLRNEHPDLLVVRYEEMREDTIGIVGRILDFVGLRTEKNFLESAIRASRFENMQALEKKHGFSLIGDEGLRDERFVRRGQIGGWQDELDDASLRILEDKYSQVMERVGYARVIT